MGLGEHARLNQTLPKESLVLYILKRHKPW